MKDRVCSKKARYKLIYDQAYPRSNREVNLNHAFPYDSASCLISCTEFAKVGHSARCCKRRMHNQMAARSFKKRTTSSAAGSFAALTATCAACAKGARPRSSAENSQADQQSEHQASMQPTHALDKHWLGEENSHAAQRTTQGCVSGTAFDTAIQDLRRRRRVTADKCS